VLADLGHAFLKRILAVFEGRAAARVADIMPVAATPQLKWLINCHALGSATVCAELPRHVDVTEPFWGGELSSGADALSFCIAAVAAHATQTRKQITQIEVFISVGNADTA